MQAADFISPFRRPDLERYQDPPLIEFTTSLPKSAAGKAPRRELREMGRRKSDESRVERFNYKEAGPQLLLQAFLQRIINGGGRIEREYGPGRK